jgi:N-acyl-phosphatidylethanolamine-hydrolysing phospholipase D
MRSRLLPIVLFFLLPALSGCAGYVQRMVTQSIGRIGDTIPDPPQMITAPIIPNARLAVGWVGHATVLVQMGDKLIITDPLFTNTIGLLVKRFVKPGLDPAILPKIDLTLISHMHFDHLSYGSLEELPKNGDLIIANGLARYVPEFGFKETVVLQPWQSFEDDSIRVTAVPVQHFNGRYGFDRAWLGNTGYSGYVVEHDGIVVFFAGDTGYNPELFKEIGRRFKIDLALIPIAPGGRGLGSYVHVSPLGAVKIMEDVRAKYMVPIHFGTMAYGSSPDPAGRLEALHEAAVQEGVADRVIPLQVGQQKVFF